MYYIYMLRCTDNSIYTGITTNVEHRMNEHFSKKNCAKYTYSHTAKKLECVWETKDRVLASKLEYQIKKLTKTQKEKLIRENNLEELFLDKIDTSQYKLHKPIREQIQELINQFDGNVSLYASDEYHNEIQINDNVIVESASCIKLFILIEYYRQILNQEKSREDILTYVYSKDYVENGSGLIQFLEEGLQLSSKNMAILMMIVSDNIATNKMIEYLGFKQINDTIKSLGCKNTELIAKKLDFNQYKSIGKTTAYEYAMIYKKILNKEILTENICKEIIEILSHQRRNEMLVKKLPIADMPIIKYIASKSGGLGSEEEAITNCRNDGGIIATKFGNYIVSIFINRFSDYHFYQDNPAILLGAEINKILFENFKKNEGKLT